MKRTYALIISVLMIVLAIVPMASCDNNKPLPKEEIFLKGGDSTGVLENLAEYIGLDSEMFDFDYDTDKNIKGGVSLALSQLELAGTPVITSPVKVGVDVIGNKDGDVSGSFNLNYLTDSLKIDIVKSGEDLFGKFDGITEYFKVAMPEMPEKDEGEYDVPKYDPDVLMLDMLDEAYDTVDPENGFQATQPAEPEYFWGSMLSQETISAFKAFAKEYGTAAIEAVDTQKLVETEKEITVGELTLNVRAIEYSIKGNELKAALEKIANTLKNGEAVKELQKIIPDFTLDTDDIEVEASDELSVIRYFKGNTAIGAVIKVTGDGETVEMKLLSASEGGKDYAVCELAVEGKNVLSLNYSKSDDKGFELKLNATATVTDYATEATTEQNVEFSVKGKTEKSDEGKVTNITLSIKSGLIVFELPVTLTVKTAKDDVVDFSLKTTIDIPGTVKAVLETAFKAELTNDEPVEVKDEDLDDRTAEEIFADEETENALMQKIPNLMQLIQTFMGGSQGNSQGNIMY